MSVCFNPTITTTTIIIINIIITTAIIIVVIIISIIKTIKTHHQAFHLHLHLHLLLLLGPARREILLGRFRCCLLLRTSNEVAATLTNDPASSYARYSDRATTGDHCVPAQALISILSVRSATDDVPTLLCTLHSTLSSPFHLIYFSPLTPARSRPLVPPAPLAPAALLPSA